MRFPVTLLLAVSLVAPGAAAQNLLVSPDFDVATDVDDWPDPFPDPDTTISWQSDLDVDGAPDSGSLRLDNSISNGASDGPRQCVVAGPGFYEMEAFFYNPTQTPQPVAQIFLEYFPSADCTGAGIGFAGETGPGTLDAWDSVFLLEEAPDGTASIGVRISSGGTTDPTPHVVFYDAVFLPEPGRLPAGACGLVALAFLVRRRAFSLSR